MNGRKFPLSPKFERLTQFDTLLYPEKGTFKEAPRNEIVDLVNKKVNNGFLCIIILFNIFQKKNH